MLTQVLNALRNHEALAFHNMRSSVFVRHINHNVEDNRVSNLQWVNLCEIIRNKNWTTDHGLFLNSEQYEYIEGLRKN